MDSGYIFIFWAGLGLTGLGLATAAPILRLLDVPERIMPEATAYLRVIFAGSLATFGYNAVSSILRGLGDSKTPLYFLIVATLVNVALDLLFVAVLDKRNEFARLDLRAIQFDKAVFAESLRIGLPTGVQQTLVAAGMMALSRVVNGFGAATMAAFAAAGRLDSFASMPAMNLGQALSTFVGQNLGAGKPERVRRGYLSALLVGACISVVTSILVMSLGAPLIAFFSTDAAVIAMINTLLALWVVRIPLAILFSGPLGMGTDGIWLSIPCGWTVGAVFSTWYYRSGKWKNKALVRTKPIVGRDESQS